MDRNSLIIGVIKRLITAVGTIKREIKDSLKEKIRGLIKGSPGWK